MKKSIPLTSKIKSVAEEKNITVISAESYKSIHELLGQGWSLDAIAGRDKLMGHSERVSTKTLYKLVKKELLTLKSSVERKE